MIFILFFFLSLLLALAQGHGGPMKNSYKPSEHYQAEWITYEVDEILYANFTIQAKINGWLAIGFNTLNTYVGYDVIIGYNNMVLDRYQETEDFDTVNDVDLHGSYDVSDIFTEYDNDILKIKFSRKLNTGDKYDYNLEQEGRINIMWAYGKMDGEDFVTENRGVGQINFIDEDEMENEGSQLKAHGIMMALVVMVLMSSGMVLSRYLKLIFPWWFYAHTTILCFAVFFMLISAIVVFQAHNYTYLPGWHSVFGLFFIIGMSLQTLLGLLSHVNFDPKRSFPPCFPDKLHWFIGRGLFFLGLITVLLGLYVLPARHLAINAFWLFLVVVFFFVIALERNIGQTHELPVKGIDDEPLQHDDESQETHIPKRGNNLSHGVVPREHSTKDLCKLLCPAGFSILFLFILVAVGINTTEM